MMYPSALRRIVLAAAVALLSLAPGALVPDEAKAGGPVAGGTFEIDQFYDELAPYGDWVYHPTYEYVWLPRSVAADWRPFTVGNWIYTEEYGWYWQSYEPFAWAVYHYGRWGFEPDYGWYWVPGDTWAPAWVQWRYSNEYVGWAPEAPTPTRGYAYGGPSRYAPPPPREAWMFVEPRYLTSPAVRSYAVPRNSLTIAFSRTTYVNRPLYRDGYVYNYGMPRDHWSRVTRRHLEPRKLYRGNHRGRPANWNRNRRDVYAYAPGVRKGARPRKPPKKIAHKPNRKKANAQAARARNARVNRAASPNPLGPRGVMNPNYRGPGASGGHAIGNYRAVEGRKIPKARANASKKHKPSAKNSKSAKSKAARSRAARSKSAKAQAQRNRAMSLGPPTRNTRPGTMSPNYRGPGARGHDPVAASKSQGRRKPPQVRRTPPKPKAATSQGHRTQGSKSKPKSVSKSKGGKPQAKAGGPNRRKPAVHQASKPKPSKSVRARASKPRTAYAKPQPARGKPAPKAKSKQTPKPKAAAHRSGKPKLARSRSAHAKPKGAHAKSGHGGGGNRKHGASRGGDRAKACKANPNKPGCGRRG